MTTTKNDKGEKPKKQPKKKKVRFDYPAEAINANDPLDRVIFFGRKLKADERDALLTADISMTLDQQSQLTLVYLDQGFQLMDAGLFIPNIPVQFEDLMLNVASVEVAPVSGHPQITVKCRPRLIQKLKKRRGPKVLRGASASDFVQSECRAVGAECVVQKSAKRKQVKRDIKKEKGQTEYPSTWTTFKRLAEEEGYVMFESMNTIFFGKPTWLMDHFKDSALPVTWGKGPDELRPLTLPTCTRADNDIKPEVTIDLEMPGLYGRKFRPGMAIEFDGVPTYEGTYIITSVEYSLLNDDVVNVSAGTPINPTKLQKVGAGGSGSGASGGHTSSLRYLCQQVGFKGDALETAIAVAMAESRGDSKALGDIALQDAKWGPSVGLFQIRSLKNPGAYSGNDALRVQSKLLDAQYNARAAYRISAGGTNWGAWSTYNSGAYRQWYKTGVDYQVKGWTTGTGAAGSGGTATGAKSASSFVAFALAQAGDTYIYGAEASLTDPNPGAFDCSELVQWAAARAGVYMPDGSSAQIAYCHPISVAQAINTKGAVLWHPGHIAISLGNGRTIEAANPGFGVGSMGAAGRFQRGGLIPNMRY